MADREVKENIKLVEYINNLFKQWAAHRQTKEVDWENNLDAFLAQNAEKWKKKDAEAKESKENWRSNVIPRTLKRKVVMAWCFITDILFQGGEIPFMLKPTKGTYDEEAPEQAENGAAKMEEIIRGQLTEAQAERELMKTILQMALQGGTFVKGPVIKTKMVKQWVPQQQEQQYPQQMVEPAPKPIYTREVFKKRIPAIEHKTIWNIFVDPESEDIQKGRGLIERAMISPYDLVKLKGLPGYDGEAIDEVISRNKGSQPNTTATLPPNLRNITNRGKSITHKEFWGRVPKAWLTEESQKEYQLKGSPAGRFDVVDDVERSGDEVEVMVGIADDILIRLHVNEERDEESGERIEGERIYHYCPWESVLDEFNGLGPADNLMDVHKMVVGGVRNFVDNKALSGNVITATVGNAMRPGQTKDLYPGKNFEFEEGTDVKSVFTSVVIPDVGSTLLDLISLFERMGDQDSNLPTILQGDTRPKQKPDTATEMNLLMQNAGKYIGQVVRNIDEKLIEPIIMAFYDYNMMRDDLPDEAKGAFECHALGFNSFYNKSVLLAALLRFLEIVKDDPNAQQIVKFKTIYEKFATALDLDKEELVYTDEEVAQAQEAQMQQQQALLQQQQQAQNEQAMQERQMEIELEKSKQQQQMGMEQQKAQQQAEIDDRQADEELEREMVRKDVEAKHAMALKDKEAQHSTAMSNMDARNKVALSAMEAKHKEKVAQIGVAQKAKTAKAGGVKKAKPAKRGGKK